MYKFEFELNDNDYFEFNRYHAHHSPANKKTLLLARFLAPLFFIAFSIYQVSKGGSPVFNYTIGGVLAAVWILFFNRYYDRLLRKQIVKFKKTGKLPYSKNALLKFEEDSIVEYSERGEQKMNYDTLENIAIDKTAIYLFLGAMHGVIIPLRVFANDEERQAFLAFINEKMPRAQ